MVPIDPRQLAALEWRQPSALNRVYELKSGDSKLAEIRFATALGTLASGRTASDVWSFKRSGYLSPIVTARMEGSEADLAAFKAKYTGRSGILTVGGEALTLRAVNFWSSEWTLEDGAGTSLMRIHEKGAVHLSAKYELTDDGKKRADLALLLCLSWYILILMSADE